MKTGQVASGLGWSALSSATNAAAQLVFLAVLARLLSSQDFGLMTMAIIALRFVSFFAELGFVQALIQKPALSSLDTTAALLMAAGLGVMLYAVVLVAAPLAADYFRTPELTSVLAAFGWTLLTSTLSGIPIALLRRQGRFKLVAAIETCAFVVGYGMVGVLCALAGWGVWSLIAATLAQQVLTALLGFVRARLQLTWPVPRQAFSHFWQFGSRYSLIGFSEFAFANIESLAIGRVFGKAELGIFNRAIMLSNMPVEQSLNAVNKVMFPALSSWSGDRQRHGDGFLLLLLGAATVSAAVACGLAAAAPDVVAILLGPQWSQASTIVAIVAFAVPPMYMYTVCGMTLDSVAALGPKLRLQLGALGVKLVLVLVAAGHGLSAIAAAVVAAEVIRCVCGLVLVSRVLRLGTMPCVLVGLCAIGVGASVFAAVSTAATLAADVRLGVRFAGELASGGIAAVLSVGLLLVVVPAQARFPHLEVMRHWNGRAMSALLRRATP